MKIQLYPGESRQHVKHDTKFDSWQSFSFGNWQDDKRNNFGALRVFNDDTIGPDSEIGMHPHQNYEILSVMLDGKMSHKDSLNNYQEITTDSIQLISCGKGIYHAGKNLAENKLTHFLQIWIHPSVQNTEPALQLRQFNAIDRKEKWDLQVSPVVSQSKIHIKQECYCSRGVFTSNTKYKLSNTKNLIWLFVLDGSININGNSANKRDAFMIENTNEFEIEIIKPADLWLMELPI
jgi:quercetin 2,3-dioxygenase